MSSEVIKIMAKTYLVLITSPQHALFPTHFYMFSMNISPNKAYNQMQDIQNISNCLNLKYFYHLPSRIQFLFAAPLISPFWETRKFDVAGIKI